MWPWLTTSAGYQPPTSFAVNPTGAPHTATTQYISSQTSTGYPSAMTQSHTDFPPSQSGTGTGYGIIGIGVRPIDSSLSSQVVYPESGPPQGDVCLSLQQQQLDEDTEIAPGGHPSVLPPNPPGALVQGPPFSQQQQQQTPLGGSAECRQPTSPVMASSHHTHNSSPFSMDYILRETPLSESPVGATSSQVAPGYAVVPQSEELVKQRSGNISPSKVLIKCDYSLNSTPNLSFNGAMNIESTLVIQK